MKQKKQKIFATDDCMDAGGRATQEAKAEDTEVTENKQRANSVLSVAYVADHS